MKLQIHKLNLDDDKLGNWFLFMGSLFELDNFFHFVEKQKQYYVGQFSPALRFTLPINRDRARFDEVYLRPVLLL